MIHIQDYLKDKTKNATLQEVGNVLNITDAMVSRYRTSNKFNASLQVAKTVYAIDNIVLHPYSEESLKFEIEKD